MMVAAAGANHQIHQEGREGIFPIYRVTKSEMVHHSPWMYKKRLEFAQKGLKPIPGMSVVDTILATERL